MTTVARTANDTASHFYLKDGTPFYEVPYADPKKGMRKTTLADAKKVGALPSVTTILKILDKPALNAWRVEQAVLACLTTARNDGEELDAFVKRVLSEERQQDQESQAAMDRGTQIHDAMEALSRGELPFGEIAPWVAPAWQAVLVYGKPISAETILVGEGYAGRTDLIQDGDGCIWIWDYKTTKKLPKDGSWTEHRLQLSAYAAAKAKENGKLIRTANCYISTIECGKFVIFQNPPWEDTFQRGFLPLVHHWQWSTEYKP